MSSPVQPPLPGPLPQIRAENAKRNAGFYSARIRWRGGKRAQRDRLATPAGFYQPRRRLSSWTTPLWAPPIGATPCPLPGKEIVQLLSQLILGICAFSPSSSGRRSRRNASTGQKNAPGLPGGSLRSCLRRPRLPNANNVNVRAPPASRGHSQTITLDPPAWINRSRITRWLRLLATSQVSAKP